MAAFRAQKRAALKKQKADKAAIIESSFHIDITGTGAIKTQPLLIKPSHALAMLEILMTVSAHLVSVSQGVGAS